MISVSQGVLKAAMTSRRGEAFEKSIGKTSERSLPERFTPTDTATLQADLVSPENETPETK